MIDGLTKCGVGSGAVDEELSETSGDGDEAEESRGTNVSEEVAVVASTDTIVEPDAMMILSFDAIITDTTMMTTRWTPDVAGFAIFGRYFHCS